MSFKSRKVTVTRGFTIPVTFCSQSWGNSLIFPVLLENYVYFCNFEKYRTIIDKQYEKRTIEINKRLWKVNTFTYEIKSEVENKKKTLLIVKSSRQIIVQGDIYHIEIRALSVWSDKVCFCVKFAFLWTIHEFYVSNLHLKQKQNICFLT